ncbi:hypothetical protein KEM56_006697, partial [Ascosphaera pollenicola]
ILRYSTTSGNFGYEFSNRYHLSHMMPDELASSPSIFSSSRMSSIDQSRMSSVDQLSDVSSRMSSIDSTFSSIDQFTNISSPPAISSEKHKITPGNRVAKRQRKSYQGNTVRRLSSNTTTGRNDRAQQPKFSCIFAHYGCDSQFKCKNEWKRHINTQHLELEMRLCDIGTCAQDAKKAHQQGGFGSCDKSIRFFNRKDLFTSHLRRLQDPIKPGHYSGPIVFDKTNQASIQKAHNEFEAQINEICKRCCVRVRDPPTRSACTYCDMTFDNWSKKLEHVGCHIEKGDIELREDFELKQWATEEGILVRTPPGSPGERIVNRKVR